MPPRLEWLDRAEMLTPPLPWDRPRWRDRGGPVVVLLHGLWRGWHAMEPLARVLDQQGFSTLNLPYPSVRLPVPALVPRVRREIERFAGDRPVHLVTHSLGGIIARAMIAESLSWNMGRLVMLAPPNGGSEIVDWSKRHRMVHWLLGPAGRSLGKDGLPASLPPLPENLEAAVIMGRRGAIPFFRKLLDDENDGIVSAGQGKLPGLRGFAVVDADHTFIQLHPDAVRMSVEFLRDGIWQETVSSEAD
jgi:pimeloyl-ACP methyl ester carboxylesterase